MSQRDDWAARTEEQLLDAALRLAAQRGWTWPMVRYAGKAIGLTASETELLVPAGPRDLAALLSRRLDDEALASLTGLDPTAMKVRERIRSAVAAWLRAARSDESAVRRWVGFLALPANIGLGLRLAWASADGLWRWAGDVAADENHYTKRALLAEIMISSLAISMTAGLGAALAHLDRRISGVMAFEKAKARFKPMQGLRRAAERLGRLRYRGTPQEHDLLLAPPPKVRFE